MLKSMKNNPATLLQDQGKLAEAEQLLLETLRVQRATLGDEHPATAKKAAAEFQAHFELFEQELALEKIEKENAERRQWDSFVPLLSSHVSHHIDMLKASLKGCTALPMDQTKSHLKGFLAQIQKEWAKHIRLTKS